MDIDATHQPVTSTDIDDAVARALQAGVPERVRVFGDFQGAKTLAWAAADWHDEPAGIYGGTQGDQPWELHLVDAGEVGA